MLRGKLEKVFRRLVDFGFRRFFGHGRSIKGVFSRPIFRAEITLEHAVPEVARQIEDVFFFVVFVIVQAVESAVHEFEFLRFRRGRGVFALVDLLVIGNGIGNANALRVGQVANILADIVLFIFKRNLFAPAKAEIAGSKDHARSDRKRRHKKNSLFHFFDPF